jgi:hypothetical protein
MNELTYELAMQVVAQQRRIEGKKRERIHAKVAEGHAGHARHLAGVERRLVRLSLLESLLSGKSVIAIAQSMGWQPPPFHREPADELAEQFLVDKFLD